MGRMDEIGEKKFLKGILSQLAVGDNFVNGFGDDISILDLGFEKNIAMKIDRAPKPLSLSNSWSNHSAWGKLAVIANISDMACCGAVTRGLMLSLVLPPSFKSSDARDIILGCQSACIENNITFLGGDTKEGKDAQVVAASIGTIEKDAITGRKKASPGDHLIIAGKVGGFLSAYKLLQNGAFNSEPEKLEFLSFMENPVAQTSPSMFIAGTRQYKSSCDLSDGIADALDLFCSPGVGIILDENKIPLHEFAFIAEERISLNRTTTAFSVGDWATAFVLSDDQYRFIEDKISGRSDIKKIGTFKKGYSRLIKCQNGELSPTPKNKNEHFKKRLEDDY